MNVLVISFNSLPMDVVSSYRVKGYCDYFHLSGIHPTVVTHRWEQNQDGKFVTHEHDAHIIVEEYETHRIIRLPYPGKEKSIGSQLKTVIEYCHGNLDIDFMESYKIFRKFLVQHIPDNQYDLIIAIFNPHFHLKLAYELYRLFHIPYVLDFRDLWNNLIVTQSYSPSIKERLINLIIKFWWKKWLGSSLFFCVAGEKWRQYLAKISNKGGYVVRNGFDYSFESPLHPPVQRVFKIIHFGRFYENQDINLFLNGYKLFFDTIHPQNALLEIIGVKPSQGVDVLQALEKLPASSWQVTEYLPKDRLMRYCAYEASLFWFPGFKEDNGSFAVKIYDYLIMHKDILMCPADNSDVQHVITSSNAGRVVNSSEEVCEYLSSRYKEFVKSGHLSYHGNEDTIKQYSRAAQVKFFANKIHEFLPSSR